MWARDRNKRDEFTLRQTRDEKYYAKRDER